MLYCLTPSRTIKRPIKHGNIYDTNTKANTPDLSDDESVAGKSDSDDKQLEQPHLKQADLQMPPAH